MSAEREEELKSSPLAVDDTDVTPMELHGVLHDGKSEAGSAHIAGSAFFYTVETLEDLIQMFLRNTLACIIICKVAELLD